MRSAGKHREEDSSYSKPALYLFYRVSLDSMINCSLFPVFSGMCSIMYSRGAVYIGSHLETYKYSTSLAQGAASDSYRQERRSTSLESKKGHL